MTESNSTNYKPVLLELFSGTGSIGRAFRARGWTVFSVDIDATAKPTLVANVLDLQWDALPPEVDCIWASPPCTHYSRARTKAKTPRDLEGSDAIVQKVLDILDFYITCSWFGRWLQGYRLRLSTIASMVSPIAKGQRFGQTRIGNQSSRCANTTVP